MFFEKKTDLISDKKKIKNTRKRSILGWSKRSRRELKTQII